MIRPGVIGNDLLIKSTDSQGEAAARARRSVPRAHPRDQHHWEHAELLFFERVIPDAPGIWDSLWYSVISITTIGYGDFSSTTVGARIGTTVFIVVIGLAAFTTSVGLLVDWVVELRDRERSGMGKSDARDHLIIVNFPGESPGAAGHQRVLDGPTTRRQGYRDCGRRDRAPAVRLGQRVRSYAARRWRKRRTAVPESSAPSRPSSSAQATTTRAPTASSRRWPSSSRT